MRPRVANSLVRMRREDEFDLGGAARRELLPALGVFGYGALEPVILAALASEATLLLVGAHGTGKSFLLERLAEALGLSFRHYNASLLSFDDLVGFPMPDASGGIRYVPTPASIQGAEAVFLDEVSRARPEVQNKLFSIVHERRVLGMPLASLRYRWSAMNPPPPEEGGASPYEGSEPLDVALADRFAFVCTVPGWGDLTDAEQEGVLLRSAEGIAPGGAASLRAAVEETRGRIPELTRRHGEEVAEKVRAVARLLPTVGFEPSPRRVAFLHRNVLAVHAAESARDRGARLAESAFLALLHSLPAAARGAPIPAVRLLPIHRRAWSGKAGGSGPETRKAKGAAELLGTVARLARCGEPARVELSAAVADALVRLPAGGRHALAVTLFEAGLTERLDGAVAAEWAALFAECASAGKLPERPASMRSAAARVAEEAVQAAEEGGTEEHWIANLLCTLLEKGTLPPGRPDGATAVREAWSAARNELWEADLAVAAGRAA